MFSDPSDFSGGMISINVSAGVATQSFTIDIFDDSIVECTESFSITILSASICTVAVGIDHSGEVIITDNDGAWK